MEALIAAILAAILGGLGVPGKVERGIETRLRQSLGEVQEVKVEVHRGHRSPLSRQVDAVEITLSSFQARSLPGGGLRIGSGGDLVGKVGKVVIHARDFRINDLPVERLDVTIKNVRYDLWKAIWRRKVEVIRVGDSRAEAWFDADALTPVVASRVKQVERLRLIFADGEVRLTGDVRLGVRIPVRLTCGLVALGGSRVYVVDPKAHVSVVPVPSFIISRLLDEINPLVNLNQGGEGPFRLEITSLRVNPQSLFMRVALKPRKRA